MSRWFGAPGHLATRQGHLQITYKGAPATFFTQLGLQACRAPEKRVPECIFSAPREAVVGFAWPVQRRRHGQYQRAAEDVQRSAGIIVA
jgi:hypothetical protein